MRIFKAMSAIAICTTALSPILASTAWAVATGSPTADSADATTLAAMKSQCDTLAAVHAADSLDTWTADVVPGSAALVSGPTEVVPLARANITSIVGTGTLVPAAPYIAGNPYRIGGSVNLFGDQRTSAGYYPTSTYDYTAEFNSTFAFAFGCTIKQAVYHAAVVVAPVDVPPVFHPAVPAEGSYINWDFGQGQGNDNSDGGPQGSCEAHNAQGASFPGWGADTNQCKFITSKPGTAAYTTPGYTIPGYTIPAYNDPAVAVGTEAGVAVNQDQTDTLAGHEANGGRVDVSGDFFIGQVVICNSPTKNPGTWRVQNGYGGGSLTGPAAGCNTAYFKIAPYGGGSQTSQGTYISVPGYN